jgi:DNA-binding response OmpR family regulator
MLRKEGFTVFDAADGRTALDRFSAHRSRIGVVLLDLVMPEMPGIEVLSELRLLQPDSG